MTVPILRNLADLRALRSTWVQAGETVGLVPTMGALHAGHLSLVEAAKHDCDRVVVTIFVNPKQFNKPEDLENYPRTEKDDARKLAPYDVDAIFVPQADEIYPEGYATTVSVSGVTDVLEGAFRPGHFDGVATVVAKLFMMTGADRAYFGEKDYQQLMLVQRMARDLNMPIDVIGCDTVRETSGLAMSSRNLRLTPEALDRAAVLNRQMRAAAEAARIGTPWGNLRAEALTQLAAAGFGEVEYFDLRCATTLAPLETPDRPARLLAAAWMEGIRLIDNIAVATIET